MARAGSIAYQVAKIIKAHNGIGQSKLKSRENSGILSEGNQKVSDKFHSYKSLDNARRGLMNLGKYAKDEFGIKNMQEISQEVIKAWLEQKELNYHSASNHLSDIAKVHEHFSISKEQIKEIRQEFKKTLDKKGQLAQQSRAYKNLDKISLTPKNDIAFQLQRDYGLRVSEATHININKQLNGNILSVQGKGGKIVEKQLTPTLVSKIKENAVEGKYEVSNQVYARELKKAIEKTGQKYNGTHGIRHSYAQSKLEEGYSKQEVSEMMGHNREEITLIYLR